MQNNAQKGENVTLTRLSRIIDLKPRNVVIIKLSTVKQGGSQPSDLNHIRRIFEEKDHDKVGIMETVSRAVVKKLEIKTDFKFATHHVTSRCNEKGDLVGKYLL